MGTLLMNDAVAHIAPRRRFDGFVFDIAGACRCLALAAFVRLEPFHPARPPAALVLLGRLQPILGFGRIGLADPVAAAILRGGIDHARDVTARPEDECLVLAAKEM